MKLEEPIIGLNYLEEVPFKDPHNGPRYTCRLCRHTAHLTEMVQHVIGRKHRQNYVETKRPDLVTWDTQNTISQAGKVIRARAEMIERQDGRGNPVLMVKRGSMDKFNTSRVPPRQAQYVDRNVPPSFTKFDNIQHLASDIPPLMDFRQMRYSLKEKNTSSFLAEEPDLNKDRQMHREEDAPCYDRMEDQQRRIEYKESDSQRQVYLDPDYHRKYDKEPQGRAVPEPGGVSRYNSREEMALGTAHREECYSEEAPAYRPYPERDLPKNFCTEETRCGPTQYQISQPLYQERDNPRRFLDRECGRQDGLKRPAWQGSSEPESKRRSFLSPVETETSSERFIHVTDYGHKRRSPPEEEVIPRLGPSTGVSSNSQRQVEVTRSLSDIPEPFRRFLGAGSNKEFIKGKRKSRFSDASAEEMQTAKEMFSDDFEATNSRNCSYSRPFTSELSPPIHGMLHPDIYTETQGPRHSESYQRGVSESENVFDILKNVEIENAEEAGFLKNKLCELLKEFKAKKSGKAGQNIHSRAVVSKDYNVRPASDLSLGHQYETTLREDLDFRQPEGLGFQENHRQRAWEPEKHVPDKWLQVVHYPAYEEPRQPKSNRSRFDEVFGRPGMSPPPTHPDEPLRFPERFQEPMHPREHRLKEDFLNPRICESPLRTEGRSRWDRGPRYSKSLDKITSTLLELVSRK
ncbi:uncharacterized protein si:ch211-13c6.2 isoform X2 [Antennarius striatus]